MGPRHSQNTVSTLATISYITNFVGGGDSSSVAAQQWLAKNKLQLITPAFVTHVNAASSRLAQHSTTNNSSHRKSYAQWTCFENGLCPITGKSSQDTKHALCTYMRLHYIWLLSCSHQLLNTFEAFYLGNTHAPRGFTLH